MHAHAHSTPVHTAHRQPLAELSLTDIIPSVSMRLDSRAIMTALSHAIEDHSADAEASTTLIATFQRLSFYMRQIERYRQLAPRMAQVFVVGIPDVTPPPVPNVTVVTIDASWPLAQEWVVLGCGPNFQAGLFARDAEGFQPGRRSRRFHAYWTTDADVVEVTANQLLESLGRPLLQLPHGTRAAFVRAQSLQQDLRRRLQGRN